MKKTGFTLIEVLVALVITVTAGVILSQAWSGNLLRIRKATLNNNVALLLERKMVEMEAKHQGKKPTEISDEEGNFGDAYPQYRWTFTAQPFEMPDMTAVLSSRSEGVDQMLLSMLSQMREAVGKAIVEGTVTVYVTAAGREVGYSVTTYFIDYDADLASLGVGP